MPRPHEEITITLAGETYEFRVPKVAPIMSAIMRMKGKGDLEQMQIMIEAQAKWIAAGVGPDTWDRIQTRLEDHGDDLDWPDISEVYQSIMGQSAGRPTTSSPASSQPLRVTTSSEEKPKPTESIFGV